jgi:CBS domain-containing protein
MTHIGSDDPHREVVRRQRQPSASRTAHVGKRLRGRPGCGGEGRVVGMITDRDICMSEASGEQ